ncbi:MAG: phospho-sugar mutase [Lachnospiraceae bacterium]|nr:phospho-sugar mutase [Lachnospiraceae bacterium]
MNYREEYKKWKSLSFLDKTLKDELVKIENDEEAIKNQFSCFVEFGTAGMRGTMGVGPNRMNYLTIRRTTLGLAKYIVMNKAEKKGVVITFDCRNNSKEYANYVAKVLTEFGIKVYISKALRPTPFLSFAVLYMKAFAGINITASHNRKEDNGYKIYLKDGAQMSPPDDQVIIKLVNEITDDEIFVDPKNVHPNTKLISIIPKSVEDAFLKGALDCMLHRDFCKKHGKELSVVYTPLHGTGYTFLKEGFKQAGFTNVHVVKSQNDECGDFKTIPYPNPETAAAFELAIKLAKEKDADICVASDPDADRMGVYVKVAKGKYVPLTGNELSSCIFEYVAYFRNKQYDMKRCLAVKSFVTTRLLDAIAKRYNVELGETPTGFKWIMRYVNESSKKLIFSCEESYGCALSNYVRDKDAIGTTLFVLEMALALKRIGYNLYDLLHMLYDHYGVHKCYAFSVIYEGLSGKDKMNSIMEKLRNSPFKKLTDINVVKMLDYKTNDVLEFKTMKKSKFNFPSTNTVKFFLDDNSTVTVRPSGTEPKIKIYFDVIDKSEELADNKFKILESALKKELA